jgi:methionine synthase II (cobalamin-independent)
MATDIHAEHVGSLLRQPWLLEAKEKYTAGAASLAELRQAEDLAADENIAMQRAVGMPVTTRTGPGDSSRCGSCHRGEGGRSGANYFEIARP